MKLGLPTGIEIDKVDTTGDQSDIPTTATPPGGFAPPEPAELAKEFPQLDILELLGQGGMGAVYKARQRQLDRLVALKVLPPQVGQMEAFAERFSREARSLARLNHPGIVMVYDFGHTDSGLYYFIMEFVDGTDLRHVIQARQFSSAQALAIVPQICEALQYAHEEGIVHRDIKPENILLNKKGRAKIADFGLAKLLDRPAAAYTLTRAGQRMGTPHYMAPEQIEHPGQVDHRADIYSLGVVFYEMLTGELPLGRFPLPSKKVHVDVRLDEVVLKTLEKEPQRRYQHASEVKTDVETISSETKAEPSGRKTPAFSDSMNGMDAIREQVWIPAVGLLVAGGIDGLAVVGAIMAGLIMFIRNTFASGFISFFGFMPGFVQLFLVIGMATYVILVILGAWNLMQLRSHRLAIAGTILAMIPFTPGSVVGLPMGIWALFVMRKEEVKTAFGQTETEVVIPPKVRDVAVSAAGDVKEVFGRGKAEVEKLLREKNAEAEQVVESTQTGTPRKKALWSLGLGILSLLIASSDAGFASRFTLGFLAAFFAIWLGVKVIKSLESYWGHLLDSGLATAGIITATISVLGLFGF
jgi:predicted Ser/Thr protein kinase